MFVGYQGCQINHFQAEVKKSSRVSSWTKKVSFGLFLVSSSVGWLNH